MTYANQRAEDAAAVRRERRNEWRESTKEDREAAEEEAARIAADQETARVAVEQETARVAAEQQAARVAAENEAARIAAERDAARAATTQSASPPGRHHDPAERDTASVGQGQGEGVARAA